MLHRVLRAAALNLLITISLFGFHTVETIVGPDQGLAAPAGIAVATDGTIYMADSGNHQIKAVDVDGVVTIVAGSGKPGNMERAGNAADLHAPSGLALDDVTRSLYIADTGNHAIRRIDLSTGAISTIAGNGRPGFTDGNSLQAQLHEPRGLALHGGVLYIADTRNHAIRAFDLANGTLTTVAGAGNPGYADGLNGLLKNPSALAVDEPFLYVADSGNHSIRRLDVTTRELVTIAGLPQPGHLDGPGANALFKDPQGITLERDSLYVADAGNHVIRAVSLLDGTVTTIAGTGKPGYQDGPASISQFKQPASIIAAGALFVADTGNDAIRVLWQTPTIASIDPNEGPSEGGTTVTITGTGFVPGGTTVTVADIDATVTWIDSQALRVIMPAGPTGTADVTVGTSGGTATLAGGWT